MTNQFQQRDPVVDDSGQRRGGVEGLRQPGEFGAGSRIDPQGLLGQMTQGDQAGPPQPVGLVGRVAER